MASGNAVMPTACNRIDDGAAPLQLGSGWRWVLAVTTTVSSSGILDAKPDEQVPPPCVTCGVRTCVIRPSISPTGSLRASSRVRERSLSTTAIVTQTKQLGGQEIGVGRGRSAGSRGCLRRRSYRSRRLPPPARRKSQIPAGRGRYAAWWQRCWPL